MKGNSHVEGFGIFNLSWNKATVTPDVYSLSFESRFEFDVAYADPLGAGAREASTKNH
jgi:hypothetical protein